MRIPFDRETELLEVAGRGPDLEQSLEPTGDGDAHEYRASAEREVLDVVRRLDEQIQPADTPDDDGASALPPPRDELAREELRSTALSRDWALPALRWYQAEALAEWRAADWRGVVELPEAADTELVGIAAIAERGVSALVLVPSRLSLDRWVRAIERCWPHAIGRIGDGEPRVAPITVVTFTAMSAWAPRIGDRFGCLIVEDAHRVGRDCSIDVLERIPATARLGLTSRRATPPDALARHLGPCVYSLSAAELEHPTRAPYDTVTVLVALSPEERVRYRELRNRFVAVYADVARSMSNLPWSEFVRAASKYVDGRRGLHAWRAYRALVAFPEGKRDMIRQLLERHRGAQVLVLTGDTNTAYEVARALLITPITHELGRAERNRALERFRRGEISALVSAQSLDEEVGLPSVTVQGCRC